MLRFNVRTHRKYPGHEIKAAINFDDRIIKDKEFDEHLKALHLKLEQIIPASLKVKYMIHAEGLVLSVKADNAGRAQSAQYQLIDHIKSAAQALKFPISE